MIKQHHLIYVPARLGSTRLKKKVLMDFLGEPLVVRTLKMLSTLKDDQCVFDVVLNTESEIIAEEVKKGNIKLLFNEYMPPNIPIYAIYAQGLQIPPTVRAFVKFLLNNETEEENN